MGRQIIKQPNGKYCVFSSIVDNIIMYDATEQDIIDWRIREEAERVTKDIKQIISDINAGEKAYGIFTKSYSQMLDTIEDIHGKEEAEKVQKLLG